MGYREGQRATQVLAWRVAQHDQWRRAESVRQGSQPASDPDASDLIDMAEDLRIYAREAGGQLRKRLVGGRWESEFREDPHGR